MKDKPAILASPSFLPKCGRDRYDELWTDSRMDTVVAAAVKNRVAVEINSLYQIPHERFVNKARRMGASFSFGANGRTEKVVGALEFRVKSRRACKNMRWGARGSLEGFCHSFPPRRIAR